MNCVQACARQPWLNYHKIPQLIDHLLEIYLPNIEILTRNKYISYIKSGYLVFWNSLVHKIAIYESLPSMEVVL